MLKTSNIGTAMKAFAPSPVVSISRGLRTFSVLRGALCVAVVTVSFSAQAATGLEILREFFLERKNDASAQVNASGTASGRRSAVPAKFPDAEVAQVTLLTPAVEGVSLTAKVHRGATVEDGLDVKFDATVPPTFRMCMAYAAIESIGMRVTGTRGALDYSTHKCIEKPVSGVVSDTIRLIRRDTAAMMGTLSPEQQQMRDGYAVVIVSVEGQIAIYRVDSVYFRRDAIRTSAR